jgi:hypothetical protein
MRNVPIMGSARSGTSMVAGLFYDKGYFMGPDLYQPREWMFSNCTWSCAGEQAGLSELEGKARRGIHSDPAAPKCLTAW